MKQVSVGSIDKAIKKVDNLDEDGLEEVTEQYALAQQLLLGYIMSAPTEYENEQLEGLLIYYFCLISESFSQESIEIKEIKEKDIDEFEEPYFQMLDDYFDADNEDIIFDFSDQPELIRFMMIEISTEDADGTTLDDDTATQLFIVATAMICLMSKSIKE